MSKIHHLFNRAFSGEYRNVTVLILGVMVMLIGELSTALAAAPIIRIFGNGETAVQMINILPLVLLAILYPIGPIWLQKFSITTVFKISLVTFMFGSFIVGVAQNLPFLIIGRVISTIGCAIILPMLPQLIEVLLPEKRFKGDVGQFEDVFLNLALIAALVFTGIAFLFDGWQIFNLILAGIGLLVFTLATYISVDLEVQKYEIEWTNFYLSFGALFIVGWLLTLTKAQLYLPSSMGIICLVAGIGSIVAYIWREIKVDNPLIDFRGLLNVKFLRSVFLQGIGTASLTILMAIGVLYLRQGLGYAIFPIGLSLIPSIVTSLVFHHGTRRIFKNMSAINKVRIAMTIMMIGWGCLTIFSTYLSVGLFIILTMVIEAGHGILIQVGKGLCHQQKSVRLSNMADIFTAQVKLMMAGLLLAILTVIMQNVTESQTLSGLPGQLSSLIGYRAAFLLFFLVTFVGWIIAMIGGRKFGIKSK